jgi:hypothetical protein
MRGSTIVFATLLTCVSAFADRAGGATTGGPATVSLTGGRAGGADAQAAKTKSDRATAVRFIDERPCKKSDSVGVRCSPSAFSPRYTFRTMKTKLRTIHTRRRATSVPRREIRAAVKAVAAQRTPEMERLIRGEATPEEVARAIGK